MSGFIASSSYNVTTENEIAVILSHFNSEFIFDIIRDNIAQKYNFYQINMPNVVASFEQYFKQLQMVYDNLDDKVSIENTRIETYKEILNILSSHYDLEIDHDSIQDYYSITYYLYDLLVSGFNNSMITFFTNYIIKEKNTIYDVLQLNNLKKNKDISTIYNKKVYKNTKLAIINANLEYVIDNLCGYDITFNTILNTIYQDKNMIRFIENIVVPRVDFFKSTYVNMIFSTVRPIILTNIRLEIQKQSMVEDISIMSLK